MTYPEARALLDFRLAALGKKPWFWRRKARKEWQAKAQAILMQYVHDSSRAFGEALQSALHRAQQQWGQARVEDGEVN